MRRGVVLLAVAAMAAGPACGSGKTDEMARAAGITPPSALAFVTLSLDPSVEQKRNLLSIAKSFPGAKVKDEFSDTRDDLLARLLNEADLDYEKDVKPWLGDEVALALLPDPSAPKEPIVVAFIELNDEGKARAALDKATKEDEDTVYKFVDDFAVVTDSEDQEALNQIAAEAADGAGLAGFSGFTKLVDQLHGDRLLLAWADLKRVGETLNRVLEDGLGSVDLTKQLRDAGKVALDVHAAPRAIVLEGVTEAQTGLKSGQPRLTESLPASTLAVLTVFGLGSSVNEALGALTAPAVPTTTTPETDAPDPTKLFSDATGMDLQDDVLSWMGGETVIAVGAIPAGESIPDIALIIEPSDKAKAEAAIPKLVAAAQHELGRNAVNAVPLAGTTSYVLNEPLEGSVQPAMALFPDRFVVALRASHLVQVATSTGAKLGAAPDYKSVVKEGTTGKTSVQLVLRIDPIREAVEEALGLGEDADYTKEVRPNLVPLDTFGARAYSVGGFDRFEVKLTVS